MNCQDFMLGGKSLGNDGDDFDLDQPIGADERWHPDQRARGRMRHTEITTANFTDRRHIFNLTATGAMPDFENTAARIVLSDWRLAAVFRASSTTTVCRSATSRSPTSRCAR